MENNINNFTKVFNKKIDIYKEIDDKDIRLIIGAYKTVYIIDINDLLTYNGNADYISYRNTYTMPHTPWTCQHLNVHHFNDCNLIYPYLDFKSNEEILEETTKIIRNSGIKFINNHIIEKSEYIIKLNKEDNKYYISYYVNNSIIDLIKDNKRTNKINFLTRILNDQKKSELAVNLHMKCVNFFNDNYSLNNGEVLENTNNIDTDVLNSSIKLYNYQINDVKWMKSIENNIDNNTNIISYDKLSSFTTYDSNFIIKEEYSLIPSNDVIHSSTKECFKYYGGNLTSDVGLGKTLICLYHILSSNLESRERYNYFVDFSNSCNYFYKRGSNRGKNCIKKLQNNFYCKEHQSSIFIDKKALVFKNLHDFNPQSFLIHVNSTNNINNSYIKTNSNLILCPSHLCDQWAQEYYSKFKDNKRVLLVVTYDQYINLTLSDILFSDIVIVSYSFLTNKKYTKTKQQDFVFNNFKLQQTHDISDSDTSKISLLNSKDFNCFNLYYWNRIICDEAHELNLNNYENDQLTNIISSFKSKYKWNITATPFVNGIYSFINLMSLNSDYLKNHNKPRLYSHNHLNLSVLNLLNLGFESDIINKCKILFRKNTKLSIQNEYAGNILTNKFQMLDFTTQERSIYDSYLRGLRTKYSDFLIKLCCHPELNNETKELIKNCKTFTEIQRVILDWNKNQLTIAENRIKILELDIKYSENEINLYNLKSDLEKENSLDTLEDLKLKLSSYKRSLSIAKKNYENTHRTWSYLKQSLEDLENKIELTCPICLDDIESDKIAITSCGHKFCWDCIYQTHQVRFENGNHTNTIKCPSCNNLITNKDIYLLNENNQRTNNIDDLDNIIQNVRSTKIGNIIHFLKTSIQKDDKIILFSQWDEMLHKVGNIISKYNINPLYCNGSVYNRKKVINKFCTDPLSNLIMLSSKNCASGINLTIANKIIFLEPIYGAQEYRYNIESQAIGRCDRISQTRPIEIHYFIIKDTIEEDIINNFINDSEMEKFMLT